MNTIIILILNCLLSVHTYKLTVNNERKRDKILQNEILMSVGGKIKLDDREMRLNNLLMQWKFSEVDYAFDNPEYFNFSHNFFEYKDTIKNSKVYQLIRKMPKGAALHLHASSLLGPDFFVNVTYKEHLYVCLEKVIKFKFALDTPTDTCEVNWMLMSDLRKSLINVTKFDEELRKNFTLVDRDSGQKHLDINTMWRRFSRIFKIIYPLLAYKPVWKEYFYESLKEFRNDNIMYVEIRSGYTCLYNLNGTMTDAYDFMNTSKQIVDRFIQDYPDFLGAKIIHSQGRQVDKQTIEEALLLTKDLKTTFPDFIAGFDLVGQEDLGEPLVTFLPELEAVKDLDYFFHAGETNWYGTLTDENLVDAVVLEAKRIGHGYALLKHPLVKAEVKKKDICVEVNVLSNSVLSLVSDIRNHPLATFIAENVPLVLSSDDPGLWEADPLTTDFYVAFIGVASRLHDLRLLKQLALNSIRYSSLTSDRKKMAYKLFDVKWKEFIEISLLAEGLH